MAEIDALTDGKFSPRQERALLAMVNAGNVRQAAQNSGISERSLHRYLANEAFRAELINFHKLVYCGALMRTETIAATAIEVLEAILKDPEADTRHKIAAAREILAVAQRHFDQRTAAISAS